MKAQGAEFSESVTTLYELMKESGVVKEQEKQEPVIVHIPVHHTPIDTLQPVIAQAIDSIMPDSLTNMIAQEQTIIDIIQNDEQADTAHVAGKANIPHYDIANLSPDTPVTRPHNKQRWSIHLAYAGGMGEQNQYNQPFIYKPAPSDVQSLPSGHEPTIPSSIDNWTDYAVYLANNPDAVSDKTRSVIMRIALNNANRPGEDKILRTSHHQMPVTWSLALKYRLDNRFGLESGLSYSRLSSDFYVNGLNKTSEKTTIRAPWQFSTTLGLGLQYHLTPSVGIFAEPSLQYYIPMKTDIETYRTEHPVTFSLPLGIRFTW